MKDKIIKAIIKNKIISILNGITITETEHDSGWWETSFGAEFGQKKLTEILKFIDELEFDTGIKNG